jgi:single-stranded-DNA-specific exonuclease
MKINTLFKNDEPITIEKYLERCGVHNPIDYMKGGAEYIDMPGDYDNMDKGYDLLFNSGHTDHYYIICDSDVDGFCSAAIAYLYLRHIDIQTEDITVLFHSKKQHGLSSDIDIDWENVKNSVIWLPDAGTNDAEQCERLYRKGNYILITDHHMKSVDNKYACIINNQMSDKVANKSLSGTGVTFKFIQYCCMTDGDDTYKSIIDFVALANIADVMDMRSMENRAFNHWGLNRPYNPFIRTLYETQIGAYVTPIDVAWKVVPLLNSVQRSNDQEMKQRVFGAFVGLCNRYDTVKDCKSYHNKQSRTVKKIYQEIIDTTPNDESKVMIIDCGQPTPYTGLVANKLRDYYNKPVLLVHKDENEYIGSCRAFSNLRQPLKDSGLMTICDGHDNVFGVGWLESNTNALEKYVNTLSIESNPINVTLECDDMSSIDEYYFEFSDKYNNLWGTNIPKPTGYFNHIPMDEIHWGIGRTSMKFEMGDIEFIKFFPTNADKQISGKYINIIAEFGVNYYMGRAKKQCIIKSWEIIN